MRAKVTVPFTGLGENDKEPKLYKKDLIIEGNLAFQAVSASAAAWTEPPSSAERDALNGQPPSRFPLQVKGEKDASTNASQGNKGGGAGSQGSTGQGASPDLGV